jgi:hypothetical protein
MELSLRCWQSGFVVNSTSCTAPDQAQVSNISVSVFIPVTEVFTRLDLVGVPLTKSFIYAE